MRLASRFMNSAAALFFMAVEISRQGQITLVPIDKEEANNESDNLPKRSTESGFIFSTNSYILIKNHVAERARFYTALTECWK